MNRKFNASLFAFLVLTLSPLISRAQSGAAFPNVFDNEKDYVNALKELRQEKDKLNKSYDKAKHDNLKKLSEAKEALNKLELDSKKVRDTAHETTPGTDEYQTLVNKGSQLGKQSTKAKEQIQKVNDARLESSKNYISEFNQIQKTETTYRANLGTMKPKSAEGKRLATETVEAKTMTLGDLMTEQKAMQAQGEADSSAKKIADAKELADLKAKLKISKDENASLKSQLHRFQVRLSSCQTNRPVSPIVSTAASTDQQRVEERSPAVDEAVLQSVPVKLNVPTYDLIPVINTAPAAK